MKQSEISPKEAETNLIHVLQNAHAGEQAAANAYWGHATSIFVSAEEKQEILKILDEELHHRQRIREMLDELNAGPRTAREWMMFSIGATIAFLCWFGGWFVPMYGAGKLESTNIEEYEVAARLAHQAGHSHLVPELLEFGEVEWDHEKYFFEKCEGHWMNRLFPAWQRPGERSGIQDRFSQWKSVAESKQ